MIIEALAAFATGGGTGLLGSAIGRGLGIFEQKEKNKSLKMELDHELSLQELQLKDRQEERENELAIVDIDASTQALKGSYEHDASYSDSALRWVRPGLTILLLILSGIIYFCTAQPDVKLSIGNQIVYLAGLAVAWWFADRSGKHGK